ncbi:cell shape-determining protein MreC [Virgibacillus pantothenticus]|uniref:rod shape-determining protein MreC n=1 Tax=Virgibacillus pantothenticus TaxID=1473 RepID=UPI001B0B284D|nr:rod shape-determining protein MreC [Virgibacillus pantothenticus]MBU8565683.1 rod shape-determining protein MreC [Virgibacillus pantothenticus]MBU8601234.1 rod shape-determining protein MreC [Virgibacillus pantothenticus]MBU8635584.1 rod shape-determining protein MreC [Virgibacillus pantothenticus]MBU8643277.1 rod shape-determining protein MreC [Virgibacillus pantothenticus]MBU8647476.1 rod shape-determining protein MreC [Virgibacillus pantothenticus]
MSFLRKKRLFILLIGFILLVALIGFSLRDREELTIVEEIVDDTVGLVQSIIHAPVNLVTDITGNIGDFKDTYKENRLLKEKLAEYKGLIYEVQELKEENEELRNNLELTESDSMRNYKSIQATVISRSPERWLEQITINKGKNDGIKKNMAVITAEGMVGKVMTPSKNSATVQLLTGFDQFNRISGKINRKGDNIVGMIEGYDKESKHLIFRIIEESKKDIKKDELIVSSGMGGVFPAELPIGKVQKVVPDKYGLTKTALVKPSADMYEINQVIVVDRAVQTDANQESEEEEGE